MRQRSTEVERVKRLNRAVKLLKKLESPKFSCPSHIALYDSSSSHTFYVLSLSTVPEKERLDQIQTYLL